MALVPAQAVAVDGPLFAKVDMGGDSSVATVRATVVQASTVFYDTLATLGIEIYCAPTADSREVWQASMTHLALEGGCFVLSASQFCRRKDYPPPPDCIFTGTEADLSPDSVVCAGAV